MSQVSSFTRARDKQNITPYLANGCPKTCWGCGKPFDVRNGHAEAIVGPGGRLYCTRFGCEEDALLSEARGPKRADPKVKATYTLV